MRIPCSNIIEGPGPSENIVTVRTATGAEEEVIVHKSSVENQQLKVSRIGNEDGRVLVELPRESTLGNWRIWVTNAEAPSL